MTTLENLYAALPSKGSVRGEEWVGRPAGKPQQGFAAAVALARVNAGGTPDKETVVKTAAIAGPRSEQGVPEARKRGNRSMPNADRAVTGFPVVGQLADPTLAPPRREVTKTSSTVAPPSSNGGQRTQDGGQRKALRTRTPDRASHTGVVGPVGSKPQLQPILPENPPTVKNGHLETTQGVGVTLPEKVETRAEARATKLVTIAVGDQAMQKPQGGNSRDTGTAPVAQVEWRNAGQEGQGGVVRRSAKTEQLAQNGRRVENERHTQSGEKIATKDNGSNIPLAAQVSPKVHPTITPTQLDEAAAKVTHTYRAPVVQPEPEGSVQRPRREEHPRSRSQREGGLGRPEAKMEVAQPGVKEIRSVSAKDKDGGRVHPESAASSPGPSVAAVLHPPVEIQTGDVANATRDVADSPIRHLGEQILDSLQASVAQGQRQVTIRLQPPELGTVLVRFREQGEQLDGTLEVAKTETRRQIEQALPEVVRSLQEAGIAIRRLDVTSAELSGQELGRGLSQQDAWSGQYGSGHHRDHFPASETMRPQPAGDYSANSQETPGADRRRVAVPGGIDVLL